MSKLGMETWRRLGKLEKKKNENDEEQDGKEDKVEAEDHGEDEKEVGVK